MDKYLNYVNILLEKLIIILLKHININNYAIKLEKKNPILWPYLFSKFNKTQNFENLY